MAHRSLGLLLVTFLVACGGDDDGGGGGGRADARPLADGGGGDGDGGSDPDGGVDGEPLIWLHGDFATNNLVKLAAIEPGGDLPATPLTTIPGGESAQLWGTGNGDYGPFDVHGGRVAYSADAEVTGRSDLYVANLDGSDPVQVVAMTEMADVTRVRFSPDGSRIAFTANLDDPGQLDAYVVDAGAAGATPTRVSPAHASDDPDLDADFLVWSRDSQALVVTGDFTENGFNEMWIADVTVADPQPVALVDRERIASDGIGLNGAVVPLLIDGNRVLFKGRLDADNRYKLWLIDQDGQNEEILPNSEIARVDDSLADVGAVGLSPDRLRIAFTADQVETIYDVWVMPVDGSMAPSQLTADLVIDDTSPNHTPPLKWSPDGQSLAFIADYASDGKIEPYVVPVAGGGQTRLAIIGASPDDGTDAISVAWSPAGDALYLVADHRVDNDTELFVLDPTQADQEPVLVIGVPESGDVNGVRASD
jgi:dipeptidyl aminopeptidase/acylaminoacyl peptidase